MVIASILADASAFDPPVWGVLLILFLALFSFLGLAFYALGFLAAIPIALKCAKTAEANGLDAGFYARRGGLYSVMSVGLGIYLLRQLQGKHTSRRAIRAYYVLLFASWMLVALYDILGFDLAEFSVSGIRYILVAPVGSLLWIVSLVYLLINWRRRKNIDKSQSYVQPGVPYILPFAFAFMTCTIPGAMSMYRILFGY